MKALEEDLKISKITSIKTMENHNNNKATDTERSLTNPWPYISEFFEYVTSENDGNQYVYKCLKCLPDTRLYKAQKRSLYGLRSHITRKHKEILNDFNKCISRASRRRYVGPSYTTPPVEIGYSNTSLELPQISTIVEKLGDQELKHGFNSRDIPTTTPARFSTQRNTVNTPSASSCENDSASHFGRLIASKLREIPSHKADEVMANILLYFSEVQKQ